MPIRVIFFFLRLVTGSKIRMPRPEEGHPHLHLHVYAFFYEISLNEIPTRIQRYAAYLNMSRNSGNIYLVDWLKNLEKIIIKNWIFWIKSTYLRNCYSDCDEIHVSGDQEAILELLFRTDAPSYWIRISYVSILTCHRYQ